MALFIVHERHDVCDRVWRGVMGKGFGRNGFRGFGSLELLEAHRRMAPDVRHQMYSRDWTRRAAPNGAYLTLL